MIINNTWTTDIILDLAKSNRLRSLSREGFLERGRGAVGIDINKQLSVYPCYRSRNFWENIADLHPERRKHILEAIDMYQPLSEVVAVAISPIGDSHIEVTTYLIKH